MDAIPEKNLRSLYHQLVCEGVRHRIPRQDAEELANDTLLTVIDRFDPARGGIATFSRTVLLNKIRNFVRDRKSPPLLPDDEDLYVEVDDPELLFTREEDLRTTKLIREKLLGALDRDEAEFLQHYEIVLDELGGRAVTETARRLNLTAQQGHNIIQRIERKAKSLLRKKAAPEIRPGLEDLRSYEAPALIRKMTDADEDRLPSFASLFTDALHPLAGRIARAGIDGSKVALDKFLSGLGEERRQRLLLLLS